MPNTILKRLDIIKNAVAMEDDELIAMQVTKLEELPLDAKVMQILALISTKRFQYVIQLIEQYKHDNSGVMVFQDPQIQGLKLELKLLENRLNELTDTQADLERQINEFNSDYMQRLGSLIEAILKKRAELLSDDSIEQQEAQQDYENFKQSLKQQIKDAPQTLTPEQQQQLKAAYRKASRLCHPDKLADDFKAQGTEFFKALNEAYRRQNLQRVMEILHTLETNATLLIVSDSITDKAILQSKIAILRKRISALEADIKRLQEDETYLCMQSITSKEDYFAEIEQQLQAELAELFELKTKYTSDVSNKLEDILSIEQVAIKEFVEQIHIPYLLHFTLYENIDSIIYNGLYRRSLLNNLKNDYFVNDGMRLDGHIDSISLSISFPNHKMFYKYRMMNTNTKGWVVIALNPSILWEYECAFCKYNAADSRISKLPKDYLNSIKSLKEMFAENNEDKGVRTANLKEFDPTDPQAEVLVFSNIPIEKIISINFSDKKLQSEFSEKHPNILSTYNKEHFSTRDYVRK